MLNVVWIGSEPEFPQAVSELVRRGAKLLIPVGTSASVTVKREVFDNSRSIHSRWQPCRVGLVESFSRPGGNVTGFSDMYADLGGKFVQFANELGEPQATVNYLWYTKWDDGQYRLEATERAAQLLGVNLRSQTIGDIAEADDVMSAIKTSGAATLIVQPSPFTYRHRASAHQFRDEFWLGGDIRFPTSGKGGCVDRVWPGLRRLVPSGCFLR